MQEFRRIVKVLFKQARMSCRVTCVKKFTFVWVVMSPTPEFGRKASTGEKSIKKKVVWTGSRNAEITFLPSCHLHCRVESTFGVNLFPVKHYGERSVKACCSSLP